MANIKGSQKINWTPALDRSFNDCKKNLANATLLSHPHSNAPLGLFTDASNNSLGACLQQLVDNEWQPLTFFSKKLTKKQSLWPAYYRELLAVYDSIQHFRHILEVRNFTIFTDHKPLIYAFQQRRDKLPPVQSNHISFISQFTTDIQFIKGESNVVADTFSRVEAIYNDTINYSCLAKSQKNYQELQNFIVNGSSFQLKEVLIPGTDVKIFCDISSPKPRPYLTPNFRKQIFDSIHNLNHPSAKITARLVSQRFV